MARPNSATIPITETEAWISRRFAPETALNFVITFAFSPPSAPPLSAAETTESHSGAIIGVLGVTLRQNSFANIGYFLHPGFWGNGYLTEALCAFIPIYFSLFPDGLPGCTRLMHDDERTFVDGLVESSNFGSIRVLEKCGFVHVGEEEVEIGMVALTFA